jgi:hypothetical protein
MSTSHDDDFKASPAFREYVATVEKTLDEVREQAIKPYRCMAFWFGVAFVLLAAASVVQWWVLP